ncbi:MAG: prolipoprotein diacylglyceryl transferase [Alphaproteobacteria bacterium]|nr:prolipoprotein diacylglyceryl transferase [Alphaproteobacteria bacterium]
MAIVIDPISPVAFSVFGFPVRWYALAYIAAFVVGYVALKYMMRSPRAAVKLTKKELDDLLTWLILGVIIGGRLGYVLFYNLPVFIENPLEIFMLWHGGMSFHGGLIGVVVATFGFARRWMRGLHILDMLAVVAPIGLFFGRIANFINMEVMGRPTDSWLGVIFRGISEVPRYPSPLFEAATEGILLTVIMFCLYRWTNLRKYAGALAGTMAMLYAIFRIFCEQFRAPDAQIGFLTSWGLTMGQLLSGIMFFCGVGLIVLAMRRGKKS